MRIYIAIVAAAVVLFAGCSKEKQTTRQMKGAWEVPVYEQWLYFTEASSSSGNRLSDRSDAHCLQRWRRDYCQSGSAGSGQQQRQRVCRTGS